MKAMCQRFVARRAAPSAKTHWSASVQTQPRTSAHAAQAFRKVAAIGAACFLVAGTPVCHAAPAGQGPSPANAPSGSGNNGEQPPNFNYTHLWTSKDGETHIRECQMQGFIKRPFAQGGGEQYVNEPSIKPEKYSFTQLPPGSYNPLHNCPGVQWVIPLAGKWYVKTTDGTKRVFGTGEALFQDNVANSPADKSPQHESGTEGDEPCNQLVIQVNRPPEIDNPCPF